MFKRLREALTLGVAVLGAGLLTLEPAQAFGFTAPGREEAWSAEERAVLSSLRLSQLPAAPRDASNRHEDSPAALALGRRLFFDARFSRDASVSCASCHDPARQFQDGRAVATGLGTGQRRAMPLVAAGRGPWLFWDGRKDSAWSQALGPLEEGAEHGGNRVQFVRLVRAHYRQAYEDLFGPLPETTRLPPDAGPFGNAAERAAWQAMDEAARDAVSRVFANLGKAIAAYEKSLRHEPSRLDRYLERMLGTAAARPAVLDAREVRGLRLFIGKGQCVSCHGGPLFTDQQFHNTGVPPRDANAPDRGRAAALTLVQQDEFNCLGRYSDARPEQCQELRFMVTQDAALEGAFKTPGLRGVAQRPPYMHAGQFNTLEEVLRHYVDAPHARVGQSELRHEHPVAPGAPRSADGRRPIALSPAEQQDLVAFLHTLSAEGPEGAGARPAVAALH